jgi:hypothetical protein
LEAVPGFEPGSASALPVLVDPVCPLVMLQLGARI